MGRPPKGSKLPYQTVENVQTYTNAAQAAHEGLPTPKLTGVIVRALLMRLQRLNPREYAHCRETIAAIANLEFSRFSSIERIDEEIRVELRKLVHGKPSLETHHRGTLLSQHAAACNYFEQESYPAKARNIQMRKDWIAAHWDRLINLLSDIRCHCRYTVELNEFLREAKKSRHRWSRRAETVKVILASLHNTTPKNVERLLKPSS